MTNSDKALALLLFVGAKRSMKMVDGIATKGFLLGESFYVQSTIESLVYGYEFIFFFRDYVMNKHPDAQFSFHNTYVNIQVGKNKSIAESMPNDDTASYSEVVVNAYIKLAESLL